MGTKNISLPPELEKFVDAKVASGEYAHASEVVRDGIRLLMQHEADKLDWLRGAIAEGLASMERGEGIPDERILEEVEKRARALSKARRRTARG